MVFFYYAETIQLLEVMQKDKEDIIHNVIIHKYFDY